MPHDRSGRAVWLAIAVLAAAIVALVAGGLAWLDTRRPATAITRGGIAFGGTLATLLGIFAFLS